MWDLFDLEGFTCATATETTVRARAHVPVWRYRYFGTWPNLELYPGSGTYHGSDLHMVFGGTEDVTGLPDTRPEAATTAYMMYAWASFVNDPVHRLDAVLAWPKFDPQQQSLVLLGYNGSAGGAQFVDPAIYDAPCESNGKIAGGSVAGAQGAF